MRERALEILVCPRCAAGLAVERACADGPEIQEGRLGCVKCGASYEITGSIPRFVPPENYARNFGFQWNLFAKTQVDKFSNISMSSDRFFHVTGWPRDMKGQKILEAGCGAGRFTHIALGTGAEVFSFDYSNAVEANLSNNGEDVNLHLFQGDIYRIPARKAYFDKVFCFGVLQHCPDPKKAFMSLIPHVKPGGEIAIDIYDLTFRAFVNMKYWLRPFTRSMDHEKLYGIVKKAVPALFPLKMWMTERVPFGKYFAFFIPIAYHKGFIKSADGLSYDELLEWSVLDTFDKYAPKYDRPKTLRTVRKWFVEAGLKDIEVCYGPNGINGKGRR